MNPIQQRHNYSAERPVRQPPLMQFYFAHALLTGLIGILMPRGDQLKEIHALIKPWLALLPGAIHISEKSPDPVFAQVFLAMSLVLAVLFSAIYVICISGNKYYMKKFSSRTQRLQGFLMIGLGMCLFTIFLWTNSYGLDGAATRSHATISVAVSGYFGILTAMNFLIVGIPLFFLLGFLSGCFCTE